jgi:hypothetical protein
VDRPGPLDIIGADRNVMDHPSRQAHGQRELNVVVSALLTVRNPGERRAYLAFANRSAAEAQKRPKLLRSVGTNSSAVF